MKQNKNIILLTAAAAMTLASCGNSNSWRLEGSVEGGADKQLIVENQTFVGWQGVDTVTLDANGKFTVTQPAKGYPEIYRLRIDGHTVYFPIDSIETVTMTGSLDNLENSYALAGSHDGEMIINAEQRINRAIAELGPDRALTDSLLKRDLANIILERPHSVVAYYIINKQINNRPLFDLGKNYDQRIVGAVANAFHENRPNDPRTSRLSEVFYAARAATGHLTNPADTLQAETIGMPDITLYDVKGRKQTLSEVADRNKVVILNFTVYGAQESPALNIALNKVYNSTHNSGVEIYQVAIDSDEPSWRAAAENLPWITVRNAGADAQRNLLAYNVGQLPTTFIIANGELAERIDDIAKLPAAVSRHL